MVDNTEDNKDYKDPDDENDHHPDSDDGSEANDAQTFFTTYDNDFEEFEDFDPDDSTLYDDKDFPNEVEVNNQVLHQAFLTSKEDDQNTQFRSKVELLPLNYEEVDNDETLIIEPELATVNDELTLEDEIETKIGFQIEKEWDEDELAKNENSNNDLTSGISIEF